jgi:hypothetical protein
MNKSGINGYLRKLNKREVIGKPPVERSPQLVIACLALWVLFVFLFIVVTAAWQ